MIIMINIMSIISIEPHPSQNLLRYVNCSPRKYHLTLLYWLYEKLISCISHVWLYLVGYKIAGAVIELDRMGTIAEEFGWYIFCVQ